MYCQMRRLTISLGLPVMRTAHLEIKLIVVSHGCVILHGVFKCIFETYEDMLKVLLMLKAFLSQNYEVRHCVLCYSFRV